MGAERRRQGSVQSKDVNKKLGKIEEQEVELGHQLCDSKKL